MGTPPAPPPGFTTAPAPRPNFPRPLTMVAPAEALARVYAAAYLSARNARAQPEMEHRARTEAEHAVRSFCRLCREEFEAEA